MSRVHFFAQLCYAQGYIELPVCLRITSLSWQGRAARQPVLQSEGGYFWVHISAETKGLGLDINAVLSHTWA